VEVARQLRPDDSLAPGLPAHSDAVGAFLTGDARVHPEERVQRVAELFFERPDLEAVALVRDGAPEGLLTRGRLLVKLARNFGHELYARKPVTRIADLSPLVLPEATPLATAVDRALARPTETAFDEVLVVGEAGAYLGHASVRELARQQGLALERSRLEHDAALSRTRDLEELERVRARFLAHATHELRSPVNAIAILAELVKMASDRGNLDQIREKVPMLLRASATLRGTVNNILDLSKLEAGRAEIAIVPLQLAELAEEVVGLARLLSGDKPVEVRCEVPGDLVVESDAQKLRQILVNLASNAAKFTDRGEIVLRASVDRDLVRLAVSDTGCGIRAEDLPRLFLPFGQLEDAHTKTHAGTGLGLVITRSLAALLGGRVTVESRRGEGSTFTVELPRNPPEEIRR
jgi:signal transduction histidine kinase